MAHAPNPYPTDLPLGRVMSEKGYQVNDIARLTGVDRWRLNDYLHGKRNPTPAILAKLAEVLDVEPGELV